MLKRLAATAVLGLVSCSSLPEPAPPLFYLCESNVAAIRTEPVDSPGELIVEVELRNHARRAFELLAKRHYGESIRLAAGETVLGRVKVLFGFRTDRISFSTESLRAREAFDLLNPPPESPCGSGA